MNRKRYFYVYNLVSPSGETHGFFADYAKARSAQARWNKSRRREGSVDTFMIGKHLVFR